MQRLFLAWMEFVTSILFIGIVAGCAFIGGLRGGVTLQQLGVQQPSQPIMIADFPLDPNGLLAGGFVGLLAATVTTGAILLLIAIASNTYKMRRILEGRR